MTIIDTQKEIHNLINKEKMLREKLQEETTELERKFEELNDLSKNYFDIKVNPNRFNVKLYDFAINIEKLISTF